MTKIEKGKRDIRVDNMGKAFATVMTVFTVIGIVAMVIPAALYFSGQSQYVPLTEAHKYWHLTTTQFWTNVTPDHKPVKGYSWIFDNLKYYDCLSMIGVLILMMTPLLAMLAGAAKAENRTYSILLLIASIEFVASIVVKSLISTMGAKKAITKVSKKK